MDDTVRTVLMIASPLLAAGIAWGTIRTQVRKIEAVVDKAIDRFDGLHDRHFKQLGDHETRLALLERAVLSLERMAQEKAR